jgi:hypothetical protein
VVPTQRFLNLVQGGNTLTARLPIPEHDETQAADAAVSFSVSFGRLAEYLHA